VHLPVRNRRRNEIFSETIDKSRLLLYNNTVNRFTRPHKLKNMKKKEIISIIIIAVVLAAILFGAIFLSNQHRHQKYAPPIESVERINLSLESDMPLPTSDDIAEYVNGEDHFLVYGNTENSVLYFACMLPDSRKTVFFKYSTLNGNISKINAEVEYTHTFYYSDRFIYYLKPKDGNYSGTVNYLCRIPTSGGNEQILAEYDLGNVTSASLHFVVENKVILSLSKKIFAYDLDKNETITLFDAEKNGFDIIVSDIWYYSGNLYFSALSETRENNIPTAENFPEDVTPVNSRYLIRLNIKTKKFSLMFEEPINCFYMTENEIIYMPKVNNVTEIGGKLMPLYSDKIFACDLDGKNSREIFSGLEIWAYSILAIKDEKIYVNDGYAETVKASIKEIDINTGEVGIYRGEETE